MTYCSPPPAAVEVGRAARSRRHERRATEPSSAATARPAARQQQRQDDRRRAGARARIGEVQHAIAVSLQQEVEADGEQAEDEQGRVRAQEAVLQRRARRPSRRARGRVVPPTSARRRRPARRSAGRSAPARPTGARERSISSSKYHLLTNSWYSGREALADARATCPGCAPRRRRRWRCRPGRAPCRAPARRRAAVAGVRDWLRASNVGSRNVVEPRRRLRDAADAADDREEGQHAHRDLHGPARARRCGARGRGSRRRCPRSSPVAGLAGPRRGAGGRARARAPRARARPRRRGRSCARCRPR